MSQALSGDQLRAYIERRASGDIGADELPMFILQQHQTDNLHFNLRFEVAADFVSWALPDGRGRTRKRSGRPSPSQTIRLTARCTKARIRGASTVGA